MRVYERGMTHDTTLLSPGSKRGLTHVFVACSLDGFIAGPNNELDWLPDHGAGAEDTFTPFFAGVGALLMGRHTYDVVQGFPGPWPYGETPVLVATTRPFTSERKSVRVVSGSIEEMVAAARETAAGRDVYIDGGTTIRSALEARLVDQMTVTVVPMILGQGIRLFAGLTRRQPLELFSSRPIGSGMVQLVYAPR
jgi:dihydrofolate reductase